MFNLGKIFRPKSGVPDVADNFKEVEKENKEGGMEIIEDEKIPSGMDVIEEDEGSLEDEMETLMQKKEEIKELQEKRLEYYNKAKQLEEKMTALGLSEEKQKALKEKIMKEGGEISREIQEIRNEYGFSASPVEVYSLRLKMLENEANRIKENLGYDYRQVKKTLDVDGFYKAAIGGLRIMFQKVEFLQNKFPDVEEVQEFASKFKVLKFTGNSFDDDAIYRKMLEELVNKLDEKIDQNTTYKTPGEVKEAQARLDRVNKLRGITEEEFDMARAQMGRFEKNNN
jgi:hypothetical protein